MRRFSTLTQRFALRPQKIHRDFTRASSKISTKSESAKPNTAASTHWFLQAGVVLGYQRQALWNNSQPQPRSAKKRGQLYADIISNIQTKINFAHLRSCVLCLRGCRALKPCGLSVASISAIVEEGRLHWIFGCLISLLCIFLDVSFLF